MNESDALQRIGELGERDGLAADELAWLLQRLVDASPEVRVAACTLLGEQLPAHEMMDTVAPLAGDREPLVRAAACEALGEVVREATAYELFALDGRPGWVAERGLVAPVDAHTVLAVLRAAADDEAEPMRVRGAALRALGYASRLAPVEALVDRFLRHGEAEARQAALAAAGASGWPERWAAAVIEALGDEADGVRAAAALAVGQLGIAEARAYLEPLTHEAPPAVQLAAATSVLLLTPDKKRTERAAQLRLLGLPDALAEEALETACEVAATRGEESNDAC